MSSTLTLHRPVATPTPGMLAMKAAVSAIIQRRNGASTPVRELYYSAHSLLRALRHHLHSGR